MKLAVPNLKTLDYKQLSIDHGEKLAIAIVGLLLVFVLWSTKWQQPIADSPTELVQQATGADEQIKKQPWPKAEIASLKTGTDLNGRVSALLTPLELSPWVMPIPLNKPYHPDRTLITKPKWLAVKDLVADAQVVDLEMDPKIAPLNEGFQRFKKVEKADKAKKNEKKEPEIEPQQDGPEDLKRTAAGGEGQGNGGGLGKMGGIGGFMGGKGRMGGGRRGSRDPGQVVQNKGKRPTRKQRKAEQEAAAEEKAALKEKEKVKPVGRGYHIVAVRGVFPLREQVAEMMRAMGNAVTRQEAQEAISLHDFKLERQTAKPGPEPWSGPWEPVDRQATVEMFQNDIYSFAPEAVSDGIVDNHICMPLPVRLVGEWGRLATHPAVKDFVLSPEEVQQQLEFQRKVIEKMQKEDEKKKKSLDKGGFTGFTDNPRKVRKRASATEPDENSKPIQQQILDDLAKKDKPSEAEINEKLTAFILKHATPQDHLLLFRYVDFNVEPGKIYRYRVKLELDNPFHTRHAEEVSDPSLIEGLYRETEYSEPTRPVYVPEDARFFVTRADARPGRSSLPNADVDLYQWFASTGTVVNQRVRAQVGQLIGGLLKARVLNPAEDTSEDEKVPFSTNDALVDVVPGFSLDPNLAQHRELLSEIASSETKEKSEPKEKKPTLDKERKTGSMIPDVLVFVDENGALRVIDGLDQEEDHQIAKQRYTFQNDQWQDAKSDDGDKMGLGGIGRGGSAKKRRGGGGRLGAGGGRKGAE